MLWGVLAHLLDARQQLRGVGLRAVRLLVHLHLILVVQRLVGIVVVGVGGVPPLHLGVLRSGCIVRMDGAGVIVVEIDYLVAVVEAVVGLWGVLGVVLCCADGIRLEVVQRIGGQVVEFSVVEAKVVVVHRSCSIPDIIYRQLMRSAVTTLGPSGARRVVWVYFTCRPVFAYGWSDVWCPSLVRRFSNTVPSSPPTAKIPLAVVPRHIYQQPLSQPRAFPAAVLRNSFRRLRPSPT